MLKEGSREVLGTPMLIMSMINLFISLLHNQPAMQTPASNQAVLYHVQLSLPPHRCCP